MASELDVLLRQYLDATAEGDVERLLIRIIEGAARPVVTRIVASAEQDAAVEVQRAHAARSARQVGDDLVPGSGTAEIVAKLVEELRAG